MSVSRLPAKGSIHQALKHSQNVKTSDNLTILYPEINISENAITWHPRQKDVMDKKHIISQAFNGTLNGGFRFAGFDSWTKQMIDLIKSGEAIYEDYSTCKSYIDYEYLCDLTDYNGNKLHFDKVALDRMKLMVEYIRMAMIELTNDKTELFDIKITKSHGYVNDKHDPDTQYYKYSYHFVVNSDKYRFRNSADAKQLVLAIENNPEVDENVTRFIDKNVYKVNEDSLQKMRCIFSYKNENDKES